MSFRRPEGKSGGGAVQGAGLYPGRSPGAADGADVDDASAGSGSPAKFMVRSPSVPQSPAGDGEAVLGAAAAESAPSLNGHAGASVRAATATPPTPHVEPRGAAGIPPTPGVVSLGSSASRIRRRDPEADRGLSVDHPSPPLRANEHTMERARESTRRAGGGALINQLQTQLQEVEAQLRVAEAVEREERQRRAAGRDGHGHEGLGGSAAALSLAPLSVCPPSLPSPAVHSAAPPSTPVATPSPRSSLRRPSSFLQLVSGKFRSRSARQQRADSKGAGHTAAGGARDGESGLAMAGLVSSVSLDILAPVVRHDPSCQSHGSESSLDATSMSSAEGEGGVKSPTRLSRSLSSMKRRFGLSRSPRQSETADPRFRPAHGEDRAGGESLRT